MTTAHLNTIMVADTLRAIKPRRAERPLQEDILAVLQRNFTKVKAEHYLTLDRRNRIDFLVTLHDAAIGIEVKTAGTAQGIATQLLRYALTGKLDGLILLTTKPIQGLPHAFAYKGRSIPLIYVCISHNALL
jgi:hypothetical protein